METTQKYSGRSLTPDVCRGIAIFLVIWGHVLQQGLHGFADASENVVFKVIYSFHMPLFALVSGYFLYASQKKKGVKELVWERSISLIRVIVIWNMIHYICSVVLDVMTGMGQTVSLKGWLESVFSGYWFLWAILFCTVEVGITVKKILEKLWLLGFIVFIPLMFISPCRWVILSIYPFFIIGFMYNKLVDGGKKIASWLKYAAILIYIVGMTVYFFVPYIGNSEWKVLLEVGLAVIKGSGGLEEFMRQAGRLLMYYVLGITGSITVIVITGLIVKKFGTNVITGFAARLGQYSLQIYILQRVLVELILSNVYQIMVQKSGQNALCENITLFTCVYSLLITIVCTGVIYCVVHYVLGGKIGKILFGR